MKERASFTNAVVSTAPAPIRNPRRDCSIKKSSKIAHASGGLATYCCPCGPHRLATVAGLRLVGGAVRPSQDARLLIPPPLGLSMRGQKSGPNRIFPLLGVVGGVRGYQFVLCRAGICM